MKNIVILSHDPLIDRIKKGFTIDELRNKGVDVTYVDLSRFFYPSIQTPYTLEESYVKKFSEEKDVLNYLATLDPSNTIFISEAVPSWKSRHIYKFLSNSKAPVIRIAIYGNSSLVKKSFIDKIRSLKLKDLCYLGLFKAYKFVNKIKIWDRVLTSNHAPEQPGGINHPDYEQFIEIMKQVPKQSKYIVFLDEAFPVHPEIMFWSGKNLSSLQAPYLQSLNLLFDHLEKTFNKEVIICAHPKSNYSGTEFGARKVVKGLTAEMVRQSQFILMHSSTSASFAILNDVPIVLLTSNEYQKTLTTTLQYQKTFASIMGLSIYDISKWRPSINDISPLEPSKRDNYIYSYLTSRGHEQEKNSEIIYKFLSKL